jgi:hypothetical protein
MPSPSPSWALQAVIQALRPQTPYKAFTDRIRTRRRVGSVDYLNAGCFGHLLEPAPVLFVIVTDEVLWLLTKRRRFAKLLCEPRVRRVFSHADVHDAPAFMVHDHECMNRLEKQRHHEHEITGPDVLPMCWLTLSSARM